MSGVEDETKGGGLRTSPELGGPGPAATIVVRSRPGKCEEPPQISETHGTGMEGEKRSVKSGLANTLIENDEREIKNNRIREITIFIWA